MTRHVWALAAIGVVLGTIGDAAGVAAARGIHPRLLLGVSVIAWACCAPLWYVLSRATGGSFAAPAALWTACGAACSIVIALAFDRRQTTIEWVGFAVILLGVLLRSFGDR